MNQVKNLKELENLSYFDKNTLSQVVEVSDKALYENIQRWIKNDILVSLKKGLYVTRKYIDNLQNQEEYLEFIANKLREPSYLSMEYVLQKYSILTESVFVYTCVTLKPKRIYENDLGRFIYRSIKPELFSGFKIKKFGEFDIFEALPEKALFDYLYLKFFRKKSVNKQLIDSLRLNLDEFDEERKKRFSQYCDLTGMEKYKNLANILFL